MIYFEKEESTKRRDSLKRKELSKKVVDSKGTGFIGRVLSKGRELKRTGLKESFGEGRIVLQEVYQKNVIEWEGGKSLVQKEEFDGKRR